MASGYVSSLLVVVLFISIAGLPRLIRQARLLQTRSWPHAQGRVESAWVSQEQHNKNIFFRGKLAYSYGVQGQRYQGTMERNFGGSEDKANAWVARFPHALPVQVRYSPKNAADSAFDEGDQVAM